MGIFNIFWLSLVYMQGQMAEVQEPVKMVIYLTLLAVDCSVLFACALFSHEVKVSKTLRRCLLSKLMFAASLAIFYDDRWNYIA